MPTLTALQDAQRVMQVSAMVIGTVIAVWGLYEYLRSRSTTTAILPPAT